LFAGLCACAALQPREVPPARPAPPQAHGFALLSPRSAGFSMTMTQQVSLIRGSSRFDALAVLEISSETVTLAGMGPFGNRMLTLSWDGAVLTKDFDPSIPRQLPAEDILRSVQLAYWPDEAILSALQPGWELKLTPGRRGLLNHGKEILSVRYQGDRFNGPIEIEDKAAGYTTIIKTLESSHE
jgi:hypothetical protein